MGNGLRGVIVTKQNNLETIDLPGPRDFLLITGGFATGLCWWIGMTAVINTGGLASASGLVVFLGAPILATAGTYLALRRRTGRALEGPGGSRRREARRHSVSGRHRQRPVRPAGRSASHTAGMHPAMRDFLVIIIGLVAVLCWWIGMTAYLNAGGLAHVEALVFLIVPVLATVGTYLAARPGNSAVRPGNSPAPRA
ncbi:hypothetical protein ASG92_03430 [Arthrobacter sp. Soil736]|nr:hypothetical protein ASG92_03430 [Arthrobacter sp. Soil736]